MKKLLLILVGALAFFWLVGKLTGGGSNVIEDERTYQKSWQSPSSDQLVSIGQLMVKNNISGCGEYHVKEIESQEYIIACTSDGQNWKYYVAWTGSEVIKLANDEMVAKLTPPY